jgi:cell division protein FtsB
MRKHLRTLFSFLPATRRQLLELKFILINAKEQIMASQDQAAEILEAQSAVLDKIATETDGLKAEVQELTDAAAAGGDVSPRLQAAIDAVVSRTAAIDAKVADAPTTGNPDTPTETDPNAPVDGS